MNTRSISRSITLGAAAVLIVLVGSLFLAGCASSGDSGSDGSSSSNRAINTTTDGKPVAQTQASQP